jgi:hypothetical protein
MKNFSLLLLLASQLAFAGWSEVAADAATTTYADRDDRQKADGTVKMWSLVNHKAFQRMVEVGYYSQKVRVEYDCQGKRTRSLAQSFHAAAMGEGKVVYADESPQEWQSAGPVELTLLRIACE